MALTRKLLKGMGLTDEQVDTIIEAHTDTTDGLKEQAKTYKTDAEKVPGLEKRIKELEASDGDDYKAKYEDEHSKFEAYKKDIAAKESAATTERLFRAELTALGITGKRADAVVRATDMTALKVKDGAFQDVKTVQESIKTEWGDFIPATTTTGAKVDTPPANTGGKYTSRAEIMKIKDYSERQKVIGENMELFGKA